MIIIQEQLDLHVTLHTCGICSADTALKHCFRLESYQTEILASELKDMFLEMIEPLSDCNASKYQVSFARAVKDELVDGVLKHAEFSCRKCIRELQFHYKQTQKTTRSNLETALAAAVDPDVQQSLGSRLFETDTAPDVDLVDEDSDGEVEAPELESTVCRRVPKLALVNGHFRGETPLCLKRLTRVEMSMVVQINCVYSLTMLKKGVHWGSNATIFSVLNDVNAIAQILPRMPTEDDYAVIRSAMDTASPRNLRYCPYNVIQALLWLEDNNHLWEGKFTRPPGSEWVGEGTHESFDTVIIPADDEDYEYLDATMQGGSPDTDGHTVNPGAPVTNMTDVLLVPTDDHQDLESQVGAIIQSTRFVCVLCDFFLCGV